MKEVISKKEMGVSRHSSIILGLLFLVIQGCAGVGPDLEKAKEQNTEQAYLAFIEKYQDQSAASEQIKEARKAISKWLFWNPSLKAKGNMEKKPGKNWHHCPTDLVLHLFCCLFRIKKNCRF